jgi:hypothetical protein
MSGRTLVVALVSCLALAVAHAEESKKTPPCHGVENFPTQIALTTMVNEKLIPDFASIYQDADRPYSLKSTLLDSKKIGRYGGSKDYPEADVYRQIQKINVSTKEGQSFELITVSEVSFVECSLTGPAVVLIAPEFRVLRPAGETVVGKKF